MPIEQNITRKLRAILSADVKGYSILMADDELFTIKTLKEYRSILSDCIERLKGRVVDSPGDNILAEFSSAVDAVECAVEIQNKLKKENARLVEDKRLEFRIGINIGDVVQDGDRIYGSGVNVAARIEGLADPGGICVSRSAYDQVKGKVEINFKYLGEHEVKNVKEPVRVYKCSLEIKHPGKQIVEKQKNSRLKWILLSSVVFVVIAVGVTVGLYWRYFYLPLPADIDPENKMSFELPNGPSIAVLPFDNMSGDPNQGAFCDGLTDSLIAALAHAPRLFIIARNSAFIYKGKPIKVQQVGSELGVTYVIEGSLQKFTDDIRITVQLVETLSGNHIWSDIYDRKFEDIFKIQDDIIVDVLNALHIALTDGEKIRHRFEGIKDFKMWLKLAKAINLYYLVTPTSNHLSRKEINEFIRIDPNNSFSHSLLGMTYILDLWYGTCEFPLICIGKATEAVRKSIQLDDKNSDAHSALAVIFLARKELERAITEAKIGISLNPNNADAYHVFGIILNYADRPKEGIDFIRKAIRLNPIPSANYLNSLGASYLGLQEYEKCVETFKQVLKLNPEYFFANIGLTLAYMRLGLNEEANRSASDLLKIRPDFSVKEFINVLPTDNKAFLKLLEEALRKAGLHD